MKISEVIDNLLKIKEEHGDIEVRCAKWSDDEDETFKTVEHIFWVVNNKGRYIALIEYD